MIWTERHELKVFLIYKQVQDGGNEDDLYWFDLKFPVPTERKSREFSNKISICQELKNEDESFTCAVSSIKMKLKNIQYVDTGKGLDQASELCKKVFEDYKDYSVSDLKRVIK